MRVRVYGIHGTLNSMVRMNHPKKAIFKKIAERSEWIIIQISGGRGSSKCKGLDTYLVGWRPPRLKWN